MSTDLPSDYRIFLELASSCLPPGYSTHKEFEDLQQCAKIEPRAARKLDYMVWTEDKRYNDASG
jgi:hypothetical protein